MDSRYIALLQDMPVFGGIRAENLDLLLRRAAVVQRRRGEYFFRENDRGSSLYVIESGRVAILKDWQGRQYLLKLMAPGDCFGEMELIDLQPRGASALAAEEARALEIPPAALQQLYHQDPRQFALIHMNMGREVARRLRELDHKVFELSETAAWPGLDAPEDSARA